MATTTKPHNYSQLTNNGERSGPAAAGRYDGAYARQGTVVSAISRWKYWILLAGLLLAAAGVAVGIKRKPVYTASSSLQVGKVNPNSPGFFGYTQSAADLATNYSRAITATGVLSRVQASTGLPPAVAATRLSAEPIPNSSVFRIIATGPTGAAAMKLANQAASAMVAFEATYNFNGDANAAFAAYQKQAAKLATAQGVVHHLSSLPENANGNGPTPALVNAQAAASVAQMRATALAAAYQQDVQAQPSSNLVSPLAAAVIASSDRAKKIELYGFAGLIAGLLVASLVAVLFEQHRAQRRPA